MKGSEGAGCSQHGGDGVGPQPLQKHVLHPVFVAGSEFGPNIKPAWVGWVLGLVLTVSGGLGTHPGSSGRPLWLGLGWAAAEGLPTSFSIITEQGALIADPSHAMHPQPAPQGSPLPAGASPSGPLYGGEGNI